MAGEASITKTLGDVATTTGDQVRSIMSDVITSRIPTLHYLDAMGRKELWPGGDQLGFNVFKELGDSNLYTDLDTLSITRPKNFTRAVFEWKQAAAPVTLSGLDMLKNNGPAAIANLIDARLQAAELTLAETLGGSISGIYSDGTESDPLKLTGLQSLVSSTPTAGTIGNLSRTNSFWQSLTVDVASAFATNGLILARRLAIQLNRGSDSANVLTVNQSTYENFLRNLQNTLSFNLPQTPAVASTAVLDLGIPMFKWFNMDVLFDDFVPADRAYMLTLRYLHWVVHEERDFVLSEFVVPADVDAIHAQIKWAGEFCASSLRNQGVMLNTDTN